MNVNCLATGFDHQLVDAIITARPTTSIAVYYQQLGRGVRINPLKEDCKVIDFSGNVKKFGKVEDFTFENLPYYGWGMFGKGGVLLSDYPIAATYRPTKESLIKNGKEKVETLKVQQDKLKKDENPVITFGMFSGRKVWDIAKSKDAKRFNSWANWYWKESQKPSRYPKNFVLLRAIEKYLKKDAMEFNKITF